MLFSDDEGLRQWKQINRLPDYYQTRDEVELIEKYAEEIVKRIKPNSVVIDLGCG